MGTALARTWPPGPGPGQLLRESLGRSSAGPDWTRDRSCTWIKSGTNPGRSAHVKTDPQQVRGRSGQVRADLGQGGPDQAQAWGRSRGPGPDKVCPICLKSLFFFVFFVFPMVFLVFWRGGFGFFVFFGFFMCFCISGCLGAVRVFVCGYVSGSLCQLQASMGAPHGPSLQSLASLTLQQ